LAVAEPGTTCSGFSTAAGLEAASFAATFRDRGLDGLAGKAAAWAASTLALVS
jgi:hypothetical protein